MKGDFFDQLSNYCLFNNFQPPSTSEGPLLHRQTEDTHHAAVTGTYSIWILYNLQVFYSWLAPI